MKWLESRFFYPHYWSKVWPKSKCCKIMCNVTFKKSFGSVSVTPFSISFDWCAKFSSALHVSMSSLFTWYTCVCVVNSRKVMENSLKVEYSWNSDLQGLLPWKKLPMPDAMACSTARKNGLIERACSCAGNFILSQKTSDSILFSDLY